MNNKIVIELNVLAASEMVSALDPNYETVKHLAALRATITDPEANSQLQIDSPAVPATQIADVVHSLLCRAADAIREKASVKSVLV